LQSSPRYKPGLLLLAFVGVCALSFALNQKRASSSQAVASSNVVSRFSVFARPVAPGDALPKHAGVVAPITRGVPTNDASLQQWLTLNGNEACVVIEGKDGAEGAPSACADMEQPGSADELLMLGASSGAAGSGAARGAPSVLAGIAPNGVSAVTVTYVDGDAVSLAVADNAFHTFTRGRAPAILTWTTAGGARHSQNVRGS